MQFTDLLLESTNETLLGNRMLGEIVQATGSRELWSERSTSDPDVTVIHYSSAILRYPEAPFSLEHILSIFCEYGVSSHFLIDRTGKVYRLVPIEKKAWHCGGSIMPEPDNRQAVNDFSIGIELMATARSGFTTRQYEALAQLCIENERIIGHTMQYVGHDIIAGERAVTLGLRTDVKTDPGSLFQWNLFYGMLSSRRTAAS